MSTTRLLLFVTKTCENEQSTFAIHCMLTYNEKHIVNNQSTGYFPRYKLMISTDESISFHKISAQDQKYSFQHHVKLHRHVSILFKT